MAQYRRLDEYQTELKEVTDKINNPDGLTGREMFLLMERERFLLRHINLCNTIKDMRLSSNLTHKQCADRLSRTFKSHQGINFKTVASIWNKCITPCLTESEMIQYNYTSLGNYYRGTIRVHTSIERIIG